MNTKAENKNTILFTTLSQIFGDKMNLARIKFFGLFICALCKVQKPYVKGFTGSLAFEHGFDIKLTQDFFMEAAGRNHTLQISFDILNFTNMLNKKWGRRYYTSNNQYTLIAFEGFKPNGTTPQFTFEKPTGDFYLIDDSGLNSSRWQAQLGIRYIF